jgi:hypothetical protein
MLDRGQRGGLCAAVGRVEQHNTNFALLPPVKDGWRITRIALRFIGALLILYGYMFASSYAEQLLWLARLFTA